MARAGISRVDDVEAAKSAGSTRSEDHEQSREDASQNLIRPLPVQDLEGEGFRRCTSAVGTKRTRRRLSCEERRKRKLR
jgi:hypothetical protein